MSECVFWTEVVICSFFAEDESFLGKAEKWNLWQTSNKKERMEQVHFKKNLQNLVEGLRLRLFTRVETILQFKDSSDSDSFCLIFKDLESIHE